MPRDIGFFEKLLPWILVGGLLFPLAALGVLAYWQFRHAMPGSGWCTLIAMVVLAGCIAYGLLWP